MPGAFQAGAKERLVCGFVVPSCNHFCSPPKKQDVTEDKGLKKKRVAEDDEIELQEAGGLGGVRVAFPFKGALEYVQTPESRVSDGTSFLRKILLVLSHAECA